MKFELLNRKWLTGGLIVSLIATGCTTWPSRLKTNPTPTPLPARAENGGSQVVDGLIRLAKSMPPEATLGSEFLAELTITAQRDAANVVVRDTIPVGASYVRSEPTAKVEGNQVVWNLGNLAAGQSIKTKVWFQADQEGNLVSDATVSALPRVRGQTFVGKPVLALAKKGPETALLGAELTYHLEVKNPGTAVARAVVVTDAVPSGMSHSSGKSELIFAIGDLAPGQSKPLAVTLKANQRGKVCNIATATSSNARPATNRTCTVILVPGLKVEQNGTKEQILGRNADYEIILANTGDTTLHDLIVSNTAPPQTSIVAAPGAVLAGPNAVWTIASLAPGAKVKQTLKLTSRATGTYCNAVTVSSGTVTDSARTCTLWTGIAALSLEVGDEPDPIQVGESTTYTIKVTNQGSADINNIKMAAQFSTEVTPVGTAQGTIRGQTASFPPVAALKSKQVLTYTITVKGAKPGDARNKFILNADELKTPVTEEESTTVY